MKLVISVIALVIIASSVICVPRTAWGPLNRELMNMAENNRKIDSALIDQLAVDIIQSVAPNRLAQTDKKKLMNRIGSVINGTAKDTELMNRSIAEAESILVAAGAKRNDAKLVSSDLKAIAEDVLEDDAKSSQRDGNRSVL